MKLKTMLIAAAIGGTVGTATAAWAGSPVYGYGSTRAAAVADANRSAAIMSQNRFDRRDCYTPVRPQDCKQNSGEWICTAHVANHAGSCGF